MVAPTWFPRPRFLSRPLSSLNLGPFHRLLNPSAGVLNPLAFLAFPVQPIVLVPPLPLRCFLAWLPRSLAVTLAIVSPGPRSFCKRPELEERYGRILCGPRSASPVVPICGDAASNSDSACVLKLGFNFVALESLPPKGESIGVHSGGGLMKRATQVVLLTASFATTQTCKAMQCHSFSVTNLMRSSSDVPKLLQEATQCNAHMRSGLQ